MKTFVRLCRDEGGASAAEYALMLAVIGATLAVAALALGVSITGSMDATSGQITTCGGGC